MRGSIADRVTRQLDTLQDTAVLGAGPGITPKVRTGQGVETKTIL